MKSVDLVFYMESPCRFILRSGKEVFGRIFVTSAKSESEYYFASNGEFMKWKNSKEEKQIGVKIKVDDIVYVEKISL